MIPIKILLLFLKSIILSFYDKKYKIIIHPIFNYRTYRLNEQIKNYLLPLRIFKDTIKLILKNNKTDEFVTYFKKSY